MQLAKLKPIENLTQVDKIEQALQEYFDRFNLLPGDALPKEMDLAKALGVSRTALREALSRFKTLGLIESRKNKGMTLAFPDPMVNLERVMTPRLLGGRTLNDIFELRLVLEIGMSELLFKRKNAENLAELKIIVEKEEKATSKKEILKYDIEFHSMLYKISGNETMLRFQKMLIPIFNHVFKGLHLEEQPLRNNEITHRDLYNTLNAGNPDEFRMKMKEHLSPYLKNII
ncbi:MAG TPA: FCD domain-containing protein [Flavisolibacter sp.]|jgi:DNA-binding FadR family transcriptional regulator|nr:FCD domain-containing protein [Flavisolibacter sp.]